MAASRVEVEFTGTNRSALAAIRGVDKAVKDLERDGKSSGSRLGSGYASGATSGFKRVEAEARSHTHRLSSIMGGAAKSIAIGGALAAGAGLVALAAGAKSAFGELVGSEKVAAQTNAVLKSTGGIANVTAKQVDALANALLRKSGIDDEAIKSGENMLLTFKNIRNEAGQGNDIFNQTTSILTDMTTAMTHGNVTSEAMSKQAIQLGKALNDPVKGMSALRRVGVTFSEDQQKLIKHLEATGHHLQAQKIILHELNSEFGGSAKALGDTFPGTVNKLRESLLNLGADILRGTLPALKGIVQGAQGAVDWLGKLSQAHGFKAKVQLVWEGIKDLGSLIGRETVNLGRDLGTKIAASVQQAGGWATVGKEIGARIGNAISFTVQTAQRLIVSLVQGINANRGAIAEAGILIASALVQKITDPVFWAAHWRELAALGLTLFGGALVKGIGGIGTRVAARFGAEITVGLTNLATRLVDLLPTRLGLIVLRLGEVGARAARALFGSMGKEAGNAEQAVERGLSRIPGILRKVFAITAVVTFVRAVVEQMGNLVSAVAGAAGRAASALGRGFDHAKDAVVGAIKSIPGVVVNVAKGIGTAIVSGVIAGLAGLPKAILDKIKSSIPGAGIVKSIFSHIPGLSGDGLVGSLDISGLFPTLTAPGSGSSAGLKPWILDDLARGKAMGLSLMSGKRAAGVRTSTGGISLHGSGQAIDMAGSEAAMAAFARAEAGRSGIAEVIHSTVGMWHPGVGWQPPSAMPAQLRADHYNHTHVGATSFARGGFAIPGAPVAADTVPAMLSPGEFVLTGHGQALLEALMPGIMGMVAGSQLPHFAAGGLVSKTPAQVNAALNSFKNWLPPWARNLKEFTALLKVLAQGASLQKMTPAQIVQYAATHAGAMPPGTTPSTTAGKTTATGSPQAYARSLLGNFGWGASEFSPLDKLWQGESGWSYKAENPHSHAYGIPQALPASKMAAAGPDWRTNPLTQVRWGLGYIKGRADYGSPSAAYRRWLGRSPHWYGLGGLVQRFQDGGPVTPGATVGSPTGGPAVVGGGGTSNAGATAGSVIGALGGSNAVAAIRAYLAQLRALLENSTTKQLVAYAAQIQREFASLKVKQTGINAAGSTLRAALEAVERATKGRLSDAAVMIGNQIATLRSQKQTPQTRAALALLERLLAAVESGSRSRVAKIVSQIQGSLAGLGRAGSAVSQAMVGLAGALNAVETSAASRIRAIQAQAAAADAAIRRGTTPLGPGQHQGPPGSVAASRPLGNEYYNPAQVPGRTDAGTHWEWRVVGGVGQWTIQAGGGPDVFPQDPASATDPGSGETPRPQTGSTPGELHAQQPGWSIEQANTWIEQVTNHPEIHGSNPNPDDYDWDPHFGWLLHNSAANIAAWQTPYVPPEPPADPGSTDPGYTDPGTDPGYTDPGTDPGATVDPIETATGEIGDFGSAVGDFGSAVGDATAAIDPAIQALQDQIDAAQKWVSPTRLVLNALQTTHQTEDLVQAVADARTALDKAKYLGDPAVIKQAQEALDTALFNQRVDELERQATAEETQHQSEIDNLQARIDFLQKGTTGTSPSNPTYVSVVGVDGQAVAVNPYAYPSVGQPNYNPKIAPSQFLTQVGGPGSPGFVSDPFAGAPAPLYFQHGGESDRYARIPRSWPRGSDRVPAMVGSGEMILSREHRSRVAGDLLTGEVLRQISGGGGGDNFEFHFHAPMLGRTEDFARDLRREFEKVVRRGGRMPVSGS